MNPRDERGVIERCAKVAEEHAEQYAQRACGVQAATARLVAGEIRKLLVREGNRLDPWACEEHAGVKIPEPYYGPYAVCTGCWVNFVDYSARSRKEQK